MRLASTAVFLLALATAGCSSRPRHVSAARFQRIYVWPPPSSTWGHSLLYVTNGCAYMLRARASFLHPQKPIQKVYFTETNALPQGFLERMRKKPTPISGG